MANRVIFAATGQFCGFRSEADIKPDYEHTASCKLKRARLRFRLSQRACPCRKTKSGRIGDAIRREVRQALYDRLAQWRVKPVNPCPRIDVYEFDCSNQHKREADGEGAARQTPGHGQGIPVGWIRSASHTSHSAMVSLARSVDPVCPLPEVAA